MDPTAALSNEVCLMIGEFCTVPDLARLAQTHRRFNDLFRPRIWERNIHDEPYCDSCLLYAAAHKRLDILEIAVNYGADMNGGPVPIPVPEGTSRPILTGLDWSKVMAYNVEFVAPRPLHIAVWNGDLDMVSFLLDHGALLGVPWLKCLPVFKRATQRLPAFLQPEVLARKPLPPSGIRSGLTVDDMSREANNLKLHPGRRDGLHSTGLVHSDLFGLMTGRDLRNINPLEIALAFPTDNNVASTLIRRRSPLAPRLTENALIRCLFVGNTNMFDRLLEYHPEVDGEDCVRYRILYILGEEVGHAIPLKMVRHAFSRIWMPNLPLFNEIRSFGSAHVSLIFFSIITGRYREALLHIHAVVNLDLGRELSGKFLHHVWLDKVPMPASIKVGNDMVKDVRLPDDNPTATRCALTRVLLRYHCEGSVLPERSNASGRCVSALYLAAVGSESCPWRFDAVRLMLDAGHQQYHVVYLDPGKQISLLQFYAEKAASDRDMQKWHRPLQLCLDYQARLDKPKKPWHPATIGTLEYSITAWVEIDGRRPLFDFFLEAATSYNIDLDYIQGLVDKYDEAGETTIREALLELSGKVFV